MKTSQRILFGVIFGVVLFMPRPSTAQVVNEVPIVQLDSATTLQLVPRESTIASTPDSYEPIVIYPGHSPAGTFNSGIIFVADQLDRNVDPFFRSRPTVITSFANIDNLSESSSLGRLIGEHLMHELQVRAWRVADIRFTRDLIVNDQGEFALSRDVKQLRESYPVANVVTGTYRSTIDGVLVNVRVIDSTNGHVISSGQTRFLRTRFIASLVDKPFVPPLIRISGVCPAGVPCGNSR